MSADKILNKMRQKQGFTTEKHQIPISTPVKHKCGHEAQYDFAKLKTEHIPGKIAKETARDCPGCRKARQEAQERAAKEKRATGHPRRPNVPPDTGLGCTFCLTYICAGHWHGVMRGPFSENIGECNTRTMRQCIDALNDCYWKWKKVTPENVVD